MLWSLPGMRGVVVLTRHWKQLPLGVEALASSRVYGHYRGSGLLGVDGPGLSPPLGTAVTFTFPLTGFIFARRVRLELVFVHWDRKPWQVAVFTLRDIGLPCQASELRPSADQQPLKLRACGVMKKEVDLACELAACSST